MPIDLPDGQMIMASLPDPLLLIDDDNVILFVNDAAETFFGRSRNRIRNHHVTSLLQLEDGALDNILAERERSLKAQDIGLILFDERTVRANILLAPVQGQAGLRLLLVEPQWPERDFPAGGGMGGEQSAMGAPAILGHEIKNPLAGIRGAAQLLARGLDQGQRTLTDLIIAEVDRIARIIDQMQHLGKTGPAHIAPVNIHVLLDRAIQTIRAGQQDLPRISINFDPSLPDVMVDSDAALQVLINLLQNAVEALRDAGTENPEIIVTTRYVLGGQLRQPESKEEGDAPVRLPIEVVVADNGPGVPRHIEEELFAPFVTSKRYGQGLGLAIVRKLMRDMNGRIVYERDERAGQTLFRMLMPMWDGKAA